MQAGTTQSHVYCCRRGPLIAMCALPNSQPWLPLPSLPAVLAEAYSDRAPSDEFEALQLAAQEQRVWHELLQVLSLGDAVIDLLTGRLGEWPAGFTQPSCHPTPWHHRTF